MSLGNLSDADAKISIEFFGVAPYYTGMKTHRSDVAVAVVFGLILFGIMIYNTIPSTSTPAVAVAQAAAPPPKDETERYDILKHFCERPVENLQQIRFMADKPAKMCNPRGQAVECWWYYQLGANQVGAVRVLAESEMRTARVGDVQFVEFAGRI